MKSVIAIDGPAGAGKSTIARILADRLGLLYLDTGAMYRAAAFQAKRKKINLNNRKDLNKMCRHMALEFKTNHDGAKVFLGNRDITSLIRSPEMDMLASRISSVQEVRDAMTALQRKIGASGGIVAEGRDMGTVVFPDADHKLFITASLEIRSERRYRERLGKGERLSREEVKRELRKRDEQDRTRFLAPLRPASDAMIIDTTSLGIEQVVEEIMTKIGNG